MEKQKAKVGMEHFKIHVVKFISLLPVCYNGTTYLLELYTIPIPSN